MSAEDRFTLRIAAAVLAVLLLVLWVSHAEDPGLPRCPKSPATSTVACH